MKPNRSCLDQRRRHNPASSLQRVYVRPALATSASARFKALLIGMIVLLSCAPARCANAQNEVTPEQKIKVAYLYNFIRYVQWTEEVFASKDSPFVIGVLQLDSHGHLLDRIAKRKLARGRKIVIRRIAKTDDIKGCHLVFLSAPIGPAVVAEADAIAMTEKQNSLLVCDTMFTSNSGAPIGFFYDRDGTIGLKINIDAMERRDLKADAKLLNIASVVRG